MSPTWIEYTLEDSLGTSSEPGNVVGRKFSRLLNSMCTTGRPVFIRNEDTPMYTERCVVQLNSLLTSPVSC